MSGICCGGGSGDRVVDKLKWSPSGATSLLQIEPIGQYPPLGWAGVASDLCPSRANPVGLDETTKGGQGIWKAAQQHKAL